MRFYVWLAAILIGIFLILIYYKGAAQLLQILSNAAQGVIQLLQGKQANGVQTPYPAAA